MAPHTRPRPTAIDQLPEECEAVVAWAAQELANTERSQTEIYGEFVGRLEAIKREHRGELEFKIPSFSMFNRHALRLAKLTARMNRAQMIANAVVDQTDGESADTLTQAATRMLKTLIVEMMENASDDGFTPKEATAAAAALYRLSMAENVSSARREKLGRQVKDALAVAKKAGVSEETLAEINRRLGAI